MFRCSVSVHDDVLCWLVLFLVCVRWCCFCVASFVGSVLVCLFGVCVLLLALHLLVLFVCVRVCCFYACLVVRVFTLCAFVLGVAG